MIFLSVYKSKIENWNSFTGSLQQRLNVTVMNVGASLFFFV